jgi:peptidoglycan hydrolase-like protein with peptidoglycan-binding domain
MSALMNPATVDTDESVDAAAPRPGRRKARRKRALMIGGGTLALAAVGAAAVGVGGRNSKATTYNPLPAATDQVTRQTLVQMQDVDGTLGYGDSTSLAGRATGTVTWLPAAGTQIRRGGTVYRVDDVPVSLLYGTLPTYRALASGATGRDVRQLERNLRALGYSGFTVDQKYTSSTAAAVKRWQKSLGVDQTGVVDPAAVVVTAGPVRVAELKVHVGDGAGAGPVLDYTGTTRVVTVDLDVQYQRFAKRGATVTVETPDGKTTKGTIVSVGTVATTAEGDSSSTVKVVVAVDRPKALGNYDKAPVTVQLVADRRANVLTVPVSALLALAEGGYGVEIVEGNATRIVTVEVGMFARGKVEVRGDGLAEGMTVGVPT